MESTLAFIVGLAALVAVLRSGPQGGALFVAGVAAYTLIRQGLLQLREQRRQSRRGSAVVAVAAAVVLVADLVALAMT